MWCVTFANVYACAALHWGRSLAAVCRLHQNDNREQAREREHMKCVHIVIVILYIVEQNEKKNNDNFAIEELFIEFFNENYLLLFLLLSKTLNFVLVRIWRRRKTLSFSMTDYHYYGVFAKIFAFFLSFIALTLIVQCRGFFY